MTQPVPKLKIMIVVPTLICGGLERNISIICNNIDNSKFDVTLAILDNSFQFFEITNKAVKVIDLKVVNVRKSLLKILKLSRDIKPDIILTAANHLNLLFAMFKWMFPKRIKILGRESSIVSINTKRAKFAALHNRLLKVFYRRLDLIICQSKYMQNDLIKNYSIHINKTCIINNAVATPYIDHDPEIDPHNAIPQLITVARLSEEKGIDRLIRSVSKLDIPFKYTIIGEGESRKQLENLITSLSLQEKVFLAGRSKKPFAQVSNPDLFLMGSYYEGMPNVLLEAGSVGIPSVAFDSPGAVREVVSNDINGFLVPDGDEQAFADTIVKALSTRFNRKSIIDETLRKYSPEIIIKQVESTLLNFAPANE